MYYVQSSYRITSGSFGGNRNFVVTRAAANVTIVHLAKYIWNNSYVNCGCGWKWRMIIAVKLPISAIGKTMPEKKIRASTGFEPVTSGMPVRYSTTPANEVNWLSSYLPVRSEMMWNIYEVIHMWTCLNWAIYCDNHSSVSSIIAVLLWIISYTLHIILITPRVVALSENEWTSPRGW